MTDQMRIRYDETTWLESNFLAIFFEMCGFMVFEERIGEFEEDLEELNDVEEIIIVAERGNLDKQFIRDTIVKNLSSMVNIDDFEQIINAYVDFSLYENITNIYYYGRDTGKETVNDINKAKCFLEESITSNNHPYLKSSILYLKYNINKYCKVKGFGFKYDIEKLYQECLEHHESITNLNYLIALSGKVTELETYYAPITLALYDDKSVKYSYFNKADILYRCGCVYSKYSTEMDNSLLHYRMAIKIVKHPLYLFDFINALRNKKNENKKIYHELINYINQLLEILNEKEKIIPLNPKELKIRFATLVYLMEYFFEKKDYAKVIVLEYELRLCYDKLNNAEFFDIVYTKDLVNRNRIITKERSKIAMKRGYSILGHLYYNMGLDEEYDRCLEIIKREFS